MNKRVFRVPALLGFGKRGFSFSCVARIGGSIGRPLRTKLSRSVKQRFKESARRVDKFVLEQPNLIATDDEVPRRLARLRIISQQAFEYLVASFVVSQGFFGGARLAATSQKVAEPLQASPTGRVGNGERLARP
jgi:hypothetical protein